jgi:hypothetical protein
MTGFWHFLHKMLLQSPTRLVFLDIAHPSQDGDHGASS